MMLMQSPSSGNGPSGREAGYWKLTFTYRVKMLLWSHIVKLMEN